MKKTEMKKKERARDAYPSCKKRMTHTARCRECEECNTAKSFTGRKNPFACDNACGGCPQEFRSIHPWPEKQVENGAVTAGFGAIGSPPGQPLEPKDDAQGEQTHEQPVRDETPAGDDHTRQDKQRQIVA